jgi:hypothetical protein
MLSSTSCREDCAGQSKTRVILANPCPAWILLDWRPCARYAESRWPMPRSDWEDFIAGLDRSMDRIVPEVSDGQLVGIRYFYVGVPQAARLGLTSGDRFVAVKDTKSAPAGGGQRSRAPARRNAAVAQKLPGLLHCRVEQEYAHARCALRVGNQTLVRPTYQVSAARVERKRDRRLLQTVGKRS